MMQVIGNINDEGTAWIASQKLPERNTRAVAKTRKERNSHVKEVYVRVEYIKGRMAARHPTEPQDQIDKMALILSVMALEGVGEDRSMGRNIHLAKCHFYSALKDGYAVHGFDITTADLGSAFAEFDVTMVEHAIVDEALFEYRNEKLNQLLEELEAQFQNPFAFGDADSVFDSDDETENPAPQA